MHQTTLYNVVVVFINLAKGYDMDTQYITALEYARKHDRTKPWIVKLCQSGRLQGAYLAGGVWVIPADCALPEPLRRGPKPVFDAAKAQAAMDAAMARRAPKPVDTLDPDLKGLIQMRFDRGDTYNQGGSCHTVDDRWLMPPEGWNKAAWRFYQSLVDGL